MWDQFHVAVSPDGNTIGTGSYNNWFHMIDQDGNNTQYQLNELSKTIAKRVENKNDFGEKIKYNLKVKKIDFHPKRNSLAVSSLNCFYLYSQ